MRLRPAAHLVALHLLLVAASPAGGQAPVVPPAADPGQQLRRAPDPAPGPRVPEATLDFQVGTPRRATEERSVDAIRFPVRDVVVVGARTLGPAEFEPILAPLRGREAALGEIVAAADRIEGLYRAAGYVLSRAFVPPQRVADGVFRIQVIEGFVKSIVIEGAGEGLRARLARILAPIVESRPARIGVLEDALRAANELPGARVQSVLKPSDEPGAADIVVLASQTPIEGAVSLTNRGSKFTGPISGQVEIVANDLLELGEQIRLTVGTTADFQEQRTVALRATAPLGAGFSAGFDVSANNGRPGYTLDPFDAQASGLQVGGRLGYTILRDRTETLAVEAALTSKASDVKFGDLEVTRDRWSVADLRLIWSETGWLDGATSAVLGVARGLTLDSGDPLTLSRTDAVAGFTKFSLDARRLQPLVDDFSLSIGLFGQYALDPLLSGEEFGIGGARAGRGYDPSELTGDHGVGVSVELRHDWRFEDSALGSLQLYGFYDFGRVWNEIPGGDRIGAGLASAGGGARLGLDFGITAGIELARPLTRPPLTERGEKPLRLLFDLAVRF